MLTIVNNCFIRPTISIRETPIKAAVIIKESINMKRERR